MSSGPPLGAQIIRARHQDTVTGSSGPTRGGLIEWALAFSPGGSVIYVSGGHR